MADSKHVYILSQYGTIYGVFTEQAALVAWVHKELPFHLWSEYRVGIYVDGYANWLPKSQIVRLNEFIKD